MNTLVLWFGVLVLIAARVWSSSMLKAIPRVGPNVRRLFLVRHGEVIPPGGVHGVHYGSQDVPLSPLGQLEAAAAAEALKSQPLYGVHSSPLSRAVYGAEQIRKYRSGLSCCVGG